MYGGESLGTRLSLEAAGLGVAGLACVNRTLINLQAYGTEVTKTSCIFQNVPAHSGNVKAPGITAFYQRQERTWHKELGDFFLVVSVLDFFQADFPA